jgi:hypothetical protein
MVKVRNIFGSLSGIFMPLAVVGILLCFLTGLADISSGHSQEDKQRLEDTLHRAAMACYAIEGFYPPDLNYLEERYGIQINRQKYVVSYVPVAENLMPDITILEK